MSVNMNVQNEVVKMHVQDVVNIGGITPAGEIDITENGKYSVTSYASANVNVPQGPTPTGTINITTNGETDVTDYATANVAVPQPTGKTTITENGTNIDVAQYATADVSVPQGVFPTGTLSITENGEKTVTTYDKVNVAVPQPSGKITIFENGTNIDVAAYATADVTVPQPSGKITITENGTGVNIASYATADIAVPQGITPTGSHTYTTNGTYDVTALAEAVVAVPQPSGKITITENGTNIDVSSYATADVSVSGGTERGVAIPYTNKLVLPDGEWLSEGRDGSLVHIGVYNNVITVHGNSVPSKYFYFKLSPYLETYAGSSANPDWKTETWDALTVGKTYGLRFFELGGTTTSTGLVAAVRSSSDSTIFGSGTGTATLTSTPAYARFYFNQGGYFTAYKVGVMITENELPTEWESLNIDPESKYYSVFSKKTSHFIDIESGRSTTLTQGMCVDADYIYCCGLDGTDTHNTFIAKYDKFTGALVDSTMSYSLGHCNSMTIKDGIIYCVKNDNDGTVFRVDTSDLTQKSSITVALSGIYSSYTGIGAIFYDEQRKEFVCLLRGNNRGYAFFDENWGFKHILWTDTLEGTYGSFAVKNGMIYQVVYNPSKIAVITRNGTHVDDINLNIGSDEPEDIKFDFYNNIIYVSANNSSFESSFVSRYIATEMKMVVRS